MMVADGQSVETTERDPPIASLMPPRTLREPWDEPQRHDNT